MDQHDARGTALIWFRVAVGFNEDECRLHEALLPHCAYLKPGQKEVVPNACVFEGLVAENDRLRLAILPSDHSAVRSMARRKPGLAPTVRTTSLRTPAPEGLGGLVPYRIAAFILSSR
jgi:hypothetical protein